MYDTRGRTCPKHPNLVHPCQICANPSSKVSSDAAENTIVDDVNWFFQSHIPYNTKAPRSLRHDNMQHFAEREGLDAHWDDPNDKVLPNRPNYGASGDVDGVASVTIVPSAVVMAGLQSGVFTVGLTPITATISVPPVIDEPFYDSVTQSLILTDDFNGYADMVAANLPYNVGRNHQFCELIAPGFGGSGKALRLNYGIGFTDDILWGTEGKLFGIGTWNGTLPEVAGPYEHLYFTTYFRFSSGADPVENDPTGSGIKGFMFWNPSGNRYEISCTRLSQTDQTRMLKIFNPSNAQSGLNVWKTSDGLAPPMTRYADGNWHRLTCEFRAGPAVPTNQRGVRIWADGVLVYDDMGVDIQTGQTYPGYSYERTISHFTVFGNFVSAGASSSPFTLDIDSWTTWTD